MKQSVNILTLVGAMFFVTATFAQSDTISALTLQQCIEYAQKNNIAVQQTVLSGTSDEIRLNTARNNRLPSLSAGIGSNAYFGRGPSRDGTYQDNTQLSLSGNLSVSIPVFQGFNIKHNIAGREFDLRASLQDIERAREDVAMQIATIYLQVLLCKELVVVAQSQVALSAQQLERSVAMVAQGKSPESQVYESRALLAKDKLSLIQSANNLNLALLDLAQAMNLEQHASLDILMPRLETIDINSLKNVSHPESVYRSAVEMRPGIKAERLRMESSRKNLLMAKSARYPQISIGAGYSNSAYHSYVENYENTKFFKQLKQNGSESVGININIPIFNRLSTRNQIRSATVDVERQRLTLSDAERKLYKEIEQSYYTAVAAYNKHLAATESVLAAREAFRYEQQKADAGRSTVFDFSDAKTRLERSESEAAQAKFEFVFRSKILDFYQGKPLEFVAY